MNRFFERDGRVRAKICGITSEEDAKMAVALGADAIGLNLYSGSKRYITMPQARKIGESIGEEALRVAVTVNMPVDEVSAVWRLGFVDMFQFHGDENKAYIVEIKRLGIPFYCAKRIDTSTTLELDVSSSVEGLVLFDAYSAREYGGSGETIDWMWLTRELKRLPNLTCILAGGLVPGNVETAIRAVRPYAVDVASGVESLPGKKDPILVGSFIEAVRRAGGL